MLKLFSTVILFSLIVFPLFSQEIKNETKIRNYLGNERFESSLEGNPGLIKFLDVKVEKGFEIESLIPDKVNDFTEISTIIYNDKVKGQQISVDEFLNHSRRESFNFLFYEFPMPENGGNGYFLLKDTGKIISVYSNHHLNQKI